LKAVIHFPTVDAYVSDLRNVANNTFGVNGVLEPPPAIGKFALQQITEQKTAPPEAFETLTVRSAPSASAISVSFDGVWLGTLIPF
jgi:hypothetical protein